jgi:uncharacterized membrane protein
MRTFAWIVFIFFTVFVGLYPFSYFVFDMSGGFPATKGQELLQSRIWNAAFYTHIFFGGIAMLAGFTQFSKKLRNRMLTLHRTFGKIYLVSVGISGITGLYIAMFASGGIISITGFSGLAIGWLVTSFVAYSAIRKVDIDKHQRWMIRSYALCFAAVTLRIYIPLFQIVLGMEFISAYRIIAWVCWVPNLLVAELIIRNLKRKKTPATAVTA